MKLLTLILLFLLLLLPSPSSAAATTILLTGDILPAPNAAFTIPSDGNLLTLTDRGQLLILSPNGSTLWSSSPPANPGLYAALLRPHGHASIFGPSLWSTPRRRSPRASESANFSPPNARNHMLSSQVLNGESKLGGGEHALVMRDDCGLELVRESEGVVWESGTKGKGRSCFARLDHRGQLAVVDDRRRVVWASKPAEVDGFFVLVVQNDGRAAVYGPAIWSSST